MITPQRRRHSPEASRLLEALPPAQLSRAVEYLEPHELAERNRLIIAEHEAGIGYATIGKRYNLSPTRIRYIIHPDQRRVLTIKPYEKTRRKRIMSASLPMANAGTADEFLALLKEADLSQARFARYMGYSEITVNNYASGKTPTPKYIMRFLHMCVTVRKYMKIVRELKLNAKGDINDAI